MQHKSYLIKVCLLILGAALFVSCSKTTKAPTPQPLDPGELSASVDTVVIDASNPGGEATTLSWTAFANSEIAYKIILTAGSNSDSVDVAKNVVSKKFTNAELNGILVDKFSLPVGTVSEVQAVVYASVALNGKTATSNSITLKVTPAPTGAAYDKLWIVGSATPNGWDIDKPNEMVKDPTNSFQFKYNEVLNAGEFKIPTTTGNWNGDYFMPSINHPALTNTAVQLITGGSPDNKWEITTPGAYKILLNISSSAFIQIKSFTPYKQLWMVGDATAAGWNIDAPVSMVPTVGNPYEFTYTGALNAGEFKIPTATGNWGTDYFMPPANDAAITETHAVFVPGGNPDNKWKITDAGNYKVTLNQLYETIKIEKQ